MAIFCKLILVCRFILCDCHGESELEYNFAFTVIILHNYYLYLTSCLHILESCLEEELWS
jgi:hypothetical protein